MLDARDVASCAGTAVRPRKWRRPPPADRHNTPCGCSTAPTWARRKASRPGWPTRAPNAATPWCWAPSMIMSATCRGRSEHPGQLVLQRRCRPANAKQFCGWLADPPPTNARPPRHTRYSGAATPNGPPPIRPYRPDRHQALPNSALDASIIRAGRAMSGRTSTLPTVPGTTRCGPIWPRAFDLPASAATRRPPGRGSASRSSTGRRPTR